MDIKEFENLAFQEYIDYQTGARYVLDFVEGTEYGDDTEDFYTIKLLNDDGESEDESAFLGTTPNNGNNVAMMAWEYNAVPVREV